MHREAVTMKRVDSALPAHTAGLPGVRPVLAIEPESGIVDFGAVVYQDGEKDYLTREVLVKNQDKSGCEEV